MTEKFRHILWPANWPYELQDDYLQFYAKNASMQHMFQGCITALHIEKQFDTNNGEFFNYIKISEWENRFTMLDKNTKQLVEIRTFNPLTIAHVEAAKMELDKIIKNEDANRIIYADCFSDNRWNMLDEFEKFPYYYVVCLNQGYLNLDLLQRIVNKDLSEIPDNELFEVIKHSHLTDSSALNVSQSIEDTLDPEVIKKLESTHPNSSSSLLRSNENAHFTNLKEEVALNPNLLKLREDTINEFQKLKITSEGKIDIAVLCYFLQNQEKGDDFLKQALKICENLHDRALLSYFRYYFTDLSYDVGRRSKLISDVINSLEGSDLPDLFASKVLAMQYQVNGNNKEAIGIYSSLADSQSNPMLKAVFLANIGTILCNMNPEDQKNSLNYYTKASELVNSVNTQHIFLPFFSYKIAEAYVKLNNYTKAKNVLEERTLKLVEAVYGPDSFEAAECYNKIGTQYFKLDVKQLAKKCFEKCLTLLDKIPGQHCLLKSDCLNHISTLR